MDQPTLAVDGFDQVEHQIHLLPAQLCRYGQKVQAAGDPAGRMPPFFQGPGDGIGLGEHVPGIGGVCIGNGVVNDGDMHQAATLHRAACGARATAESIIQPINF